MADYVIRQSNQRGPQGATGPSLALAANTIAGNNTGSTANAAALTVSQVRNLIGLGTNDTPDFTGIGIGRAGFAGHIDLYDDVDDVTIEIDAIQNGIQVGGNITAVGRVSAETITASANAAASTPSVKIIGTPFTDGTATTTKPLVLIEPTGTISNAWSTKSTMIGVNAGASFDGNLIDVQVAASSKFKVAYNGAATFAAGVTATAATLTGALTLHSTGIIAGAATVSATEVSYLDGVTSAIQGQIDGKQATLVSGTNIKTINGSTALGSGDLVVGAAAVLTAWDVPSGSGALNGQTTDSGHTWVTSGTGYLTTSINAGGYIEGTDNTYCYLNTGSKVKRVTQFKRGPLCTIAILLDTDLDDMVHVNFTQSTGAVSVLFWKTGLGSALIPSASQTIKATACADPNQTREYTVELVGDYLIAYVDGELALWAYDPQFSTVAGNWIFAQIHASGDRIYGVYSYRDTAAAEDEKFGILPVGGLKAGYVSSTALHVGDPLVASFDADSKIYLWHEHNSPVLVDSSGTTHLRLRATEAGYGSRFDVYNTAGVGLSLVFAGDYVARLQTNNADRITFPWATSRVDFAVPIGLKSYAVAGVPSAETAGQMIYVSNESGGAVVAFSDGTNWRRVTDRAIVS